MCTCAWLFELRSLNLAGRNLSGTLPSDWGSLSSLSYVTCARGCWDRSLLPRLLHARRAFCAVKVERLLVHSRTFGIAGRNLMTRQSYPVCSACVPRLMHLSSNAIGGRIPSRFVGLPAIRYVLLRCAVSHLVCRSRCRPSHHPPLPSHPSLSVAYCALR